MTVKNLADTEIFNSITLPCPERKICGVYIGDLLSWVVGRASSDQAWITIMSNVNIVAVATLADTACIILAEDVTLEKDVIDTATERGINILSSKKSSYEIAVFLSKVI